MSMLLVMFALVQDLSVRPCPVEVGARAEVTVRDDSGPVTGAVLADVAPDGTVHDLGATDAAGRLSFEPREPGLHRLETTIAGVRVVAPFSVTVARPRWLYAATCVPLGVALFVVAWRRRPRRAVH